MLSIDIHKLLHQFAYIPRQPLIFSSALFLFMFMGFISVFYLLHRRHNVKLLYVVLFSYYFYYKSSGIYFLLLILSTVVDYNLANIMANAPKGWQRKGLLIFSLILNLGLLGYFKYTNFLYEIFCGAAHSHFSPFQIFLPVGVSFFTFQSLSYTIDIYRGELKPVKRILDYAFFVSFFPQLVAGPIVRARDFIPQISLPTIVTRAMFSEGMFLIISGLFKKAVISDYISANFVDRIFDNPTLYTGLENLFGVYGYALQIYCDFSGYSDMAIGIALLFGYRLCLNFDSPYQSSSITEFWRRWHISLSTWLRDYLYISLGGNRKGKFRTYLNQFITMLLGGLWHGAAFRFILWGALHGVALGIDKAFKQYVKIPTNPITKILGVLFTFHFVCFCWIFFRADNMQIAGSVISQIALHFTPSIFRKFITGYENVLLVMLLGYVLHFMPKNLEVQAQNWTYRMPLAAKVAMMAVVVVIVVQVKSSDIQPCIYFQF
jgi:D-alanyl-lipoteichoic acid acyltransferase DltB (MBOAT superfamily)